MALPEAEWGARSPALGITEVPPGGHGRHRHLHEKLCGGGGFETPMAEGGQRRVLLLLSPPPPRACRGAVRALGL